MYVHAWLLHWYATRRGLDLDTDARREALLAHVNLKMSNSESGKSIRYFSAPLPAGSTRSLQKLLAPSSVVVDGSQSGFELGSAIQVGAGGRFPDVCAAGSLENADQLSGMAKGLVFFKVLIQNLARPVRTKVDGQKSLSGCKVICLHRILQLTPGSSTCVISLTPLLTDGRLEPVTLQLSSLASDTLMNLRDWEPSSDVSVQFASHVSVPEGLLAHVPRVLEVMATSPQGTPLEVFDSGDAKEVVKLLVTEGFVDGPPWVLNMAGKQGIECGVRLVNPQKVACPAGPGGCINDFTVLQVILVLDREGWEHLECNRAEINNMKKLPYHRHEVKRWHSKRK